MAQYNTTLAEMISSIRQIKPNCPAPLCRDFINQRVRTALDKKTFWAGLWKRGTINIPAQYSTGTVTVTYLSPTVTGASTAWPVSDAVNTTIPDGVTEPGIRVIEPASMSGIQEGSLLYVDGVDPEVVSVLEVSRTSFKAIFDREHSEGCTVTMSSLVGRQFRLGNTYPIYSIRAVPSSTELELDMDWAGATISGSSYSIVKMYYTFSHDIKDILSVVDPAVPNDLSLHYPQALLDKNDPQRAASGDPLRVSDLFPDEAGNMVYEIYPPQTSARHLQISYVRQWPELKRNNDRPPHFINPNVFIYGALAQALRTKIGEQDIYYDPRTADYYELKAQAELDGAMLADDGKSQQQITHDTRGTGHMGANWDQSHDVSNGDSRWW